MLRRAAGWFGRKGSAPATFFYLIARIITASIVAHSATDGLVARWLANAPAEPGA